MDHDVEIEIIGKTAPILFLEPLTAAGARVFGPDGMKVGSLVCWTREGDPRAAFQAKADEQGISVRWA